MLEIEIVDFVNWYLKTPVLFQYEWKTASVEFDSGLIQTNQIWAKPRRHWIFEYNWMLKAKRDKFVELFQRVRGRASPFLLRDRYDYEGQRYYIQYGSTTAFQVIKRYYPNTAEFWDEAKHYLVVNSVYAYINDVAQFEGPQYSVNYSTGVVTFASPPPLASVVRLDFQFYFKVMFSVDMLVSSKSAPILWSFQPIHLVEVK